MRPATEGGLILGLKIGASISQFLFLVMTARWFGVEFRGELALFSAAVQLVVLAAGFVSGSSIVFVASREPTRRYLTRLLAATWTACVVIPVAVAVGARAIGASLGPEQQPLVLVSVLYSLLVTNACVLLAGHAAWKATMVEFLRSFTLLALAVAVASTRGYRAPDELYVIWSASALISFLLTLPFLVSHWRRLAPGRPETGSSLAGVIRQLVGRGVVAQTANAVQFLNYRVLYFALEHHAGLAAVGLFSTAVSLAEALWLPTSSLAALALNRVSRADSERGTRTFVLRLTRVSILGMLLAAGAVLLVPGTAITALLGPGFAGVRQLVVWLLPGIVVFGVSMVAAAYNAGNGLYGRNLVSALIGFVVIFSGLLWLVPVAGAGGAVVTMNASYLASGGWLLASLLIRERVLAGELVPRAADVRVVVGERS